MTVGAVGVVLAALSPTAYAGSGGRAAHLTVSGVTGQVAGVSPTGTKVKVSFTVTDSGSSASGAKTAAVVLVGSGHTYSLGTATVPGVPEGGSRTVTLTHVPAPQTRAGTYQVKVCLPPHPGGPCADSGTTTVVIAPPVLTASATTLTFPDTASATPSAAMSTTLTNTGQSTTGVVDLTLGGADSAAFSFTKGCHRALAPGQTCTPTIVFTPSHSGSSTATVTVTGGAGGSTSIKLSGTSPAAGLSISPTTFAFPDTAVGGTTTNQFTVTNNGTATTGPLSAALSGSGAAAYAADASACPAAGLAAAATCKVTVTFKPTAAGSSAATLSVSGSPGGSATATLSGKTPGTAPGGTGLTVDPTSHDYGPVAIGTHAAFPFTVKNNGSTATGALTVQLVGAQAGSYSEDPGTCTAGLAAGASCTVTVSYNPTVGGSFAATLTVSPATGTPASATLDGTTPAGIAVSPTSYDYGTVDVGSSASHTFTVSNTGGQSAGTLTIAVSGANAASYALGTSTCPATLGAGVSCTVVVTFKPASSGAKPASLGVTSSSGAAASADLTGTGAAPAKLVLTPASYNYGSALVGSNTSHMFTLTNTGDQTSGALAFSLSPVDDFNGTATCPAALAGGTSCTIYVSFTPSSKGSKSATLTASASPGGSAMSSLSGTGLAPASLSISPTTYDYGAVTTNHVAFHSFTVTNDGDQASGTVTVGISGTNAADYVVTATDCGASLAGGDTCSVSVKFTPSGSGTRSASLTVSGSPGGSASSSLSGTGQAPATITINPTFHDYGNHDMGTTTAFTFVVSNPGDTDRDVSQFNSGGSADFSTDFANSTCKATGSVPAHSSCTIVVDYTAFLGTDTGYVELKGDDFDVTAQVSGTSNN